MAFTANGNRKLAQRIKELYGVDENGKSLHHQRAGKAARHGDTGYFNKLKETDEGRKRLAEIASRGGLASAEKKRTNGA